MAFTPDRRCRGDYCTRDHVPGSGWGSPTGRHGHLHPEALSARLAGASIGAFEVAGRLVASTAVQPTHTPEEYRATIVGQVHPAYRKRGFGTFLLRWSIAEASRLLDTCSPNRAHVLQLSTESLSAGAVHLFERHGFKQRFAEDVMRRDLDAPLPDVAVPPGIRLATWVPALASQFFTVYQAAFRERPGYPDWSQEEWIAWLETGGDDFRPELSLLAYQDDVPVGFIVCADRWIIQMGVRPEWRERGIGSALVAEVLRRFRAAGGDHVLLDVNVNNPCAARLYEQLGFQPVGRRARYAHVLT